jgi:FdhE protein
MHQLTGNSEQRSLLESYESELSALLSEYTSAKLFKKDPQPIPRGEVASRLSEGRYLLRTTEVEVDTKSCSEISYELLHFLKKHATCNEEGYSFIKGVFISGEVHCSDFLEKVFQNREAEIQKIGRQFGLRQKLLSFFAVYLARPYRAAAAQILTQDVDLRSWRCGYCPVCGHWPGLSHLHTDTDDRQLWCRHCGVDWSFGKQSCPFCLNEQTRTIEIISPVSVDPCRAQACGCRRYIKEIRTTQAIKDFPFDSEYFKLTAIDRAIATERYIQESPLAVRFSDPDGDEVLSYGERPAVAVQ